jgi:uncharacterized membrane protein YbjE (DUF340 family)
MSSNLSNREKYVGAILILSLLTAAGIYVLDVLHYPVSFKVGLAVAAFIGWYVLGRIWPSEEP